MQYQIMFMELRTNRLTMIHISDQVALLPSFVPSRYHHSYLEPLKSKHKESTPRGGGIEFTPKRG